jgi:hypothetical protein
MMQVEWSDQPKGPSLGKGLLFKIGSAKEFCADSDGGLKRMFREAKKV